MSRFPLRSLLVSFLLSTLLMVVSWPLLRAVHARLGLSAPPLSGLVILGGGIVLALGGGALIGHGIGKLTESNPASFVPLLAALAALAWGIFVVVTVAPLYASSVMDSMTRDGSALLWRERGHLAEHARETATRIQRGEARQAAEATAREVYSKTKTIALRGAAMLPALFLLGWAILIPPFLGAWECRHVRA